MTYPLISVIVPLYNSSAYLDICLQSLASQTYRNFEVIMIDDASQDDTVVKASKWAHQYANFYLFRQTRNHGVAIARNVGLMHANGELISFMDPDDWCERDFLQNFANHAFHNDLIISGFFDNDKVVKNFSFLSNGRYHAKRILPLILANFGNIRGYVWNKCYRHELIDKYQLQFANDLTIMEDMLFNVQYLKHAQWCYYTNHATYHYIKHRNSIVHTVTKQMVIDILKATWRSDKVILFNK